MKTTCLTILLIITLLKQVQSQSQNFRQTYNYDGYIVLDNKQRLSIKLNFLVLSDSLITGFYYYNSQNGVLQLSGKVNKDNSLSFSEWDNRKVNTGSFDGKTSKDRRFISGIWKSKDKKHRFPFYLNLSAKMQSYWDYIKRDRALKEYKDLDLAIKDADKVLSVDLEGQHLKKLPSGTKKLRRMLSINLLGNDLDRFPKVLTELPQLEEASFASTGMKVIGPEIGKLKNLRILILDLNLLSQLPKEIGELTSLLYLDVSMNKNLKSLPASIANLKQLQELRIERTAISRQDIQQIKKWLPNCVVVSD